MNRTSAWLAFTLLAAAGCGGKSNPPPANVKGCWGDDCAIVATSHYNPDFSGVGTLNAVEHANGKVVKNLDSSLDPDVTLSIEDNKLYVLNRDKGAFRRYDFATLTVESEIATGSAEAPNAASGPAAFWRNGKGRVYVALAYNDAAHAVAVLDESKPDAGAVKYIPLTAAATDPDGNPEPAALWACNNFLYVVLQDYTIMDHATVFNAPGRLAVIDLNSETAIGYINLTGKNPYDIVAQGSDCSQVFVASSSNLTTVPDGSAGIERVDLTARATKGFAIADTALMGRPSLLAVAGPNRVYVDMYSDPEPDGMGNIVLSSSQIVAWDPTSSAAPVAVAKPAGFINFIKIGPDKNLYAAAGTFSGAADPNKLPPGLYIGPADGSQLPTTPLDLGDTPSAIAFQNH